MFGHLAATNNIEMHRFLHELSFDVSNAIEFVMRLSDEAGIYRQWLLNALRKLVALAAVIVELLN